MEELKLEEPLKPMRGKNSLFGFFRAFKEVIPCMYQEAEPFENGMAAVKSNNRWGFIDEHGSPVIPCYYDFVDSFVEGIAAVELNEKWLFIKSDGYIIPGYYDEVLDFSEGLAGVKVGDKWGFIDTKGKIKIDFIYDDTLGFAEGFAAVKIKDKWGFVDGDGKEAISLKYDAVTNFSTVFTQAVIDTLAKETFNTRRFRVINLITGKEVTKNTNNLPMLLAKARRKEKPPFSNNNNNTRLKESFIKVAEQLVLVDLCGIEFLIKGGFFLPDALKNIFPERYDRKCYYQNFEIEDDVDGYGINYNCYGAYNGYSDDVIDDAFDGDPGTTWNVD